MKKLVIIISLFLSACLKEESNLEPITPTQLEIRLNSLNNQAHYLRLESLSERQNTNPGKWHLKFQNDKNSWSIYLNPLETVAVYKTESTSFTEIDENYNLVGREWKIDAPTNSGIFPALADWGDFNFENPESFRDVYIIRLKEGLTAKFYKMQLQDAVGDAYKLRYASLDGSVDNSVLIAKNQDYTHSFIELADTAKYPNVEPLNNNWDVCFGYVADSISRFESLPHIETINKSYGVFPSVLLNQSFCKVALDSSTNFNDIDYFSDNKLDYLSIDHLKNTLVTWNKTIETASPNEKLTLLIKKDELYYAANLSEIYGNYPENFEMSLSFKKL